MKCQSKDHVSAECGKPSTNVEQKISKRGFVCPQCNGDHHVKNCPDLPCSVCHEPGHVFADCPDSNKGIRCFKCDMFGHHIQNCPFVECKNCGASGHWVKDCTNKKNEFRKRFAGPAREEERKVVSVDYHHMANAPSRPLAPVASPAKVKPLMTHFYEKLVARGRNPELAGQMMLYWRLAEHNDQTLTDLFRRNSPCSRDTLRLVLVSELANAPSSCRPMDVTASDLLDETIDYFMPKTWTVGVDVPAPSSIMTHQFFKQSNAAMTSLMSSSSSRPSEATIVDSAEEGRFESLQPLQEYIARKMRSLSSMFGIEESYILKVSTSIQRMLAEVGLCLFTLRRHYTTFGKESLSETIEEKMSTSKTQLPERVSGSYVVAIVSDFLNDFCK
jgi:hypothetical protein